MIGAAALTITAGLALGLLRMHNSNPRVRSAEWLGDLVLGAVYATPGALAVLGTRQRPALLLAAGLLAMPLGVTSIVAFPLLVPATVFLIAGGLDRDIASAKARSGVAAVLVGVVSAIGAFVALVALSTDYSWTDGSMSGSTSGLFTTRGALLAIVLLITGIAGAAWLAAPRHADRLPGPA